jgi:hypothetical protein
MRHLLVIVFAVLFCCVTASAQPASSLRPSTPYELSGVTFVSPNEAGWAALVSNGSETTFEKRDKDANSTAGVKTLKTKVFETEKDQLVGWESLKNEALQALKLQKDSLHFNHLRFKGAMCVQYDASYPLDAATPPKFARYNVKGYLCPLLDAKDMVVQIEITNYSNTKGFSEAQLPMTEDFFENIRLPKKPAKP